VAEIRERKRKKGRIKERIERRSERKGGLFPPFLSLSFPKGVEA